MKSGNPVGLLVVAAVISGGHTVHAADTNSWVEPMKQVHGRFTGTPGTFATFGDSITVSMAFWAALRGEPRNMPDDMTAAHALVREYMRPECWAGWKGPAFGNNGSMTIRWAHENVDRWLRSHNPEVAVIMFGTNDLGQLEVEEFEHKTADVVERCLKNGTVVLLTTLPPRSGLLDKSRQFAAAVRRVAAQKQVPLIDYHAEIHKRRPDDWDGALPKFKAIPGSEYEVPTLLARDGVHPSNPRAHQDFSPESLSRNGFALRNYLTLLAYAETIRKVLPAGKATAAVLLKSASFYASFDDEVRGDFGGGDLSPATRFNHDTEKGKVVFQKGIDNKVFRIAGGKGIHGGALEATDVLPKNGRIFFPAKGNLAFKSGGWGGAVSVWINTDPNKLFKSKFCDPIQITQKGAHNGGIWFDFNDARPRDLRHGAFPAVAAGQSPLKEEDPNAPMVRVPMIDLKQGDWHHVVLSWKNFDTGRPDAASTLYIDGERIGDVKDRAIAMDWDLDKAGIYVAVGYIGLLDELAVFKRSLTPEEVQTLREQPGLLAPLKKSTKKAAANGSKVIAEKLAPYFRPPAEFANDLGAYRSPLRFADGSTVKNPQDWQRRRQEILKSWHEVMGPWPALLERPRIEILAKERRDNFEQQHIRLEIAPGRSTDDAYLLIPEGNGPFPAVLVVFYDAKTGIGLGKTPFCDFAYQLAKRGFVTLSLGSPPASYYPDKETAQLQPLSFHAYVAANCRTTLAHLPQVDPKRIGVVGHSYGGKWAMFASCLHDKFACGVWSDGGIVFDEKRGNVNYWEPWYLGHEPGRDRKAGIPSDKNPRTGAYRRLIESGAELHELHALMAPRPFLVSGGSEDPPERWQALNHAVAVNALLGRKNNVAMTNRKGHSPTPESNEQVYEFFQYALKMEPLP